MIWSIHIPKTAGTSFYALLKENFNSVSPSLKRRDISKSIDEDWWLDLRRQYEVVHGHFYYEEIRPFMNKEEDQLITWLRHPVDRVISNYNFFKAGLKNPSRNPIQFWKNRHRKRETLLEYARKNENRNRMTQFLSGSQIQDFSFMGILEEMDVSLERLSGLWNMSLTHLPTLNVGKRSQDKLDESVRKELEELNQLDVELYFKVLNGGHELVG